MLKKLIFYFLIFLLLLLDFAALHDILKKEPNPYLEYFILFSSLIIFLLIIFRVLRKLYISLLILTLIGITVFVGFSHREKKKKEKTEIKTEIKKQKNIFLPKDKETCEKQGGVWKRIGVSLVESCNFKTKDAGKVCFSDKDCEGTCLATLSQEQRQKVTKGIPVLTSGKCSSWLKTVGCQARVENGMVKRILCRD